MDEALIGLLALAYAKRYRLDPDDLAQEARLALWRCKWAFDPARGERSWWVQRVVRAALNEWVRRRLGLRNKHRRAEVVVSMAEEWGLSAWDSHPSEAWGDLYAALNGLPPHWRRALWLHYWCGYEWAEVAAALGLSRGGTYEIHREARKRLRARLEMMGYGEE